jgi:hypothetical protein
LLLAAASSASVAQSLAPRSPLDHNNGEDVLGPDENYVGTRVGGFDVRAAAGLSLGYDSNVYAQDSNPEAQAMSVGEALFRADNESARREVFGTAFVRARRFADVDDQDTTEFGAAGGLDAWIGAQDRLTAAFSAERNYESRTEIETPTNIPVSLYNDYRAQVELAHSFNRFSLESELSAVRNEYESAGQDFRNRTLSRGELRGAYQLRGDLAWVVTGYFNRDDYDESSELTSSADTAGALVGLRGEVSDILEFEIGGGYFERRFENSIAELRGVAVRGSLAWHPTRLTSVRAQIQRSDEPTQIAGAFGKIRTDGMVQIGHEYTRNLRFYAGVRLVFEDFETIDRVDRLYLAELGMNYSMGRHSVLRFTYDYGSRENGTSERDFVRHVATLSFIGRL